MTTQQINTEVQALINNGVHPANILISLDKNGRAGWGDVVVLPADEMTEAMYSIGWSTDGMIDGDEFQRWFL